MAQAFSSRGGAQLALVLWLPLAAALTASLASAGGVGWINSALFALPVTLVFVFGAGYSTFYLCRAYPLARRDVAPIMAVLGTAALVSGLLWTGLGVAWNELSLSLGVSWAGIRLPRPVTAILCALGVLLYGLSAALHYLAIEFERAQQAERTGLEAKLAAREAELRMLRTQIDPHFLFNSLHSISALTSRDAAGARAMTLQLADFFRLSLGLEAHTQVTLELEVRLLEHFLAIETVRFGPRLRVVQRIDAAARECLVMPMLIQPLVENAVKHGVAQLPQGGAIVIEAERRGSLLWVRVVNDIDVDLAASSAGGIGLANVRKRLAVAYGHEASVHWGRHGNTFSVVMSMPAVTAQGR